MNDEASSSRSVQSQDHHAHPLIDDDTVRGLSTEEANDRKQRARRKRLEFLSDILRSFDVLIYAELAAVYYMDCSFIRFALRGAIQFFYLTPKSPIFPEPPQHRPYIGGIIGTNIVCLLLHLYFSRPEAGEATRGYLHGGLLIDFIGQRGPTSKLHLAILDLVIMILQLTMLAASMKQLKLKGTSTSSNSVRGTEETTTEGQQDHDAEERGVLRRSSTASAIAEEDPLPTENEELLASASSLRDLDATSGPAPSEMDTLDVYASGQAMVVDLHVLQTVREQYRAYQNRSVEADTAAGSDAYRARGLITELARRRLGIGTTARGRS